MGTLRQLRRHGDQLVWTQPGFQIPVDVDLKPTALLHRGANHDHSVRSGKALMGEKEDVRYLRALDSVTLDHPEHGQGEVPPGDYWVETKLDYDHMENESREVVD